MECYNTSNSNYNNSPNSSNNNGGNNKSQSIASAVLNSLTLSSDARRTRVRSRKPFTMMNGEIVTLGFSHEGDFFIVDGDNSLRCRISEHELRPHHKNTCSAIGFVSVDL